MNEKGLTKGFVAAVAVAAALWFWMFSPWTAGLTPFWLTMAFSAVVLTSAALCCGFSLRSLMPINFSTLLCGAAIAAVLWGMFWVGDKVSSWLFGFARPQVDSIYNMKDGFPSWVIALLLLFVIGPAEELFWRGFVQQRLSRIWGDTKGFIVATLVYTLIHLWSFNFMLIMAALVAGFVWGLLYRIKPSLLPALVISHALWDACVFVVFPI